MLQTVSPAALEAERDVVVAPQPPAKPSAAASQDQEGDLEQEDAYDEHDCRELGERVAAADGLKRERGEEKADEVAACITEEDRRLRRVENEEAEARACREDRGVAPRRVDCRQRQERDRGQPRDEPVADVGQIDRVDEHDDPDEREHSIEERSSGQRKRGAERYDCRGTHQLEHELRQDRELEHVVHDTDREKEAPPTANSRPRGWRSTTSAPTRKPRATAMPPSVATGRVCAGTSGSEVDQARPAARRPDDDRPDGGEGCGDAEAQPESGGAVAAETGHTRHASPLGPLVPTRQPDSNDSSIEK